VQQGLPEGHGTLPEMRGQIENGQARLLDVAWFIEGQVSMLSADEPALLVLLCQTAMIQ
jgi:hypothetical protein